jgi:lipoprotein-anchoring transpeptidase ErfK/SrfK
MTARPFRAALALLALLIGLSLAPIAHAEGALYFPATGHHLTDDQGFLGFWRAHDGERLLGFPVSEGFAAGDLTVQYFERGRLEQASDASGGSSVRNGSVGAEYAVALWKQFAAAPPRKTTANLIVFEGTGHTLREPFLSFWRAGGGEGFFGVAISEPLWEMTPSGRRQVQYFERARLERDPHLAGKPDEVRVGDLGSALALLNGVDTAPVDNMGYESYGPGAPLSPDIAPLNPPMPMPAPAPVAPAPARPARAPRPQPQRQPAAPRSSGGKLIVVNLSDQWLYAYEGDEQVFAAPVSTGRDGMNTPAGTYSIYAKLKSQTMDGVTNGEYWVVPNVPNVMYINGGVALHGTYWHNKFGTGARLSHGCVNLPLKAAAWLYDWAPSGTTVKVTY